jgi:electron transfer flavoprotein alpha subunit
VVANPSGILVVVELVEGKPISLVYESLGLAKRLSEKLGGPVCAALVGNGVEAVAKDLIAQGADKVFIADHPLLADYQGDAWVPALKKIVETAMPSVVLIGNTTSGTDLAPRLAFRLGSSVAMGCLEVTAENGKLQATRSCFGNKARAKISFKTTPAIMTIKPKSQEPLARDDGRSGEIVKVAVELQPLRTKIVSREKEKSEGVKLENANVVVSGGRGLGGPEGFKELEKLAGLLKGAVGASRVAVDLGWVPPSWQIGLTGKTVTPDIYFAIGISGASHHLAGCGGSKAIIAINSDPEAAIFNDAKFGVVGDLKQIVPALIEEVRKVKA